MTNQPRRAIVMGASVAGIWAARVLAFLGGQSVGHAGHESLRAGSDVAGFSAGGGASVTM